MADLTPYRQGQALYYIAPSCLTDSTPAEVIERMWRNRISQNYVQRVLNSLTTEQKDSLLKAAQKEVDEAKAKVEQYGGEIMILTGM